MVRFGVGWGKLMAGPFPLLSGVVVVPFKAIVERRQHIAKQRHRVTNSAAYDAALLRQRGSLMVWFTDSAIAAWKAEPRSTRGG